MNKLDRRLMVESTKLIGLPVYTPQSNDPPLKDPKLPRMTKFQWNQLERTKFKKCYTNDKLYKGITK